MKIICSYILFFIFLFSFIPVSAQNINDTIRYDVDSNIISSPRKEKNYGDAVYISAQREGNYTINVYSGELMTPVYSFDTSAVKQSKVKIDYYKKYSASAPLNFKECLYVAPANTSYYDLYHSILSLPGKGREKVQAPLPSSFLFYSDTLNYRDPEKYSSQYLMYLKLRRPLEDFYQSFYFKKSEVTNKEYREFVNWVRDSVIRDYLVQQGDSSFILKLKADGDYLLNKKKKIDPSDTVLAKRLEGMFMPEEERYYRRKEYDARKINYVFNCGNDKCVANVFPDTLSWVHDFYGDWMEPYVNMYFWHKAYDDYPVVGVSEVQAEAFLAWKTSQKQAELDKEHSNYIVKYELPDEMEWEMVATENEKGVYAPLFSSMYDNDFFTSLRLKNDTCGSADVTLKNEYREGGTQNYKLLFSKDVSRTKYRKPWWDNPAPGLCLFSAKLRSHKKLYPDLVINSCKDENGVLFMGNNVSEWMKDTYKQNWLPVYFYHQSKLNSINSKYFKRMLETERFFNEGNDTSGVMIRGGNWYDPSLSAVGNKNMEGINKKTFSDPNKSYATVGFRYVIKVYRKDEEEQIKKMNSGNKSGCWVFYKRMWNKINH